ncbi:MAG: hypothetical protein AAFO82_21230, partial [Bacteroidota bacterium]
MLQRIYLLCLILLFLSYACESPQTSPTEISKQEEERINPLFQLLPSEQTNVRFSNTLDEGLNTNILVYEYFYNGGGVAAADFNDDGLIDLYFISHIGGK